VQPAPKGGRLSVPGSKKMAEALSHTKIVSFQTRNKAAYSRIILLIEKNRVFTCIMAIYDKKDTYKTSFTHVCTCKHWKNEKTHVVTPDLWHSCVLFSVGLVIR